MDHAEGHNLTYGMGWGGRRHVDGSGPDVRDEAGDSAFVALVAFGRSEGAVQ